MRSEGDLVGPHVAKDPHYNSGTSRPYTVRGKTYYPRVPDTGHSETGVASWYAGESPNRTTANGEVFVPDGISAAHKTFPLPSIAEVTNLDTGKTIRVRVNDRGPFVDDRVMDLSRGAAKALGVYASGTAHVRITWLGPADPMTSTPVYVASAPSSDDRRRYIVQLGAFSVKDNAETARDRLEAARIDQRGALYIVYTGPFASAAAAEGHRQEAIDAGFSGAILVRAE
ncbi:septal ring lytic transglycosylase RlpA family protein [Asticcacaulis sp. 201]|uniref:septal ring lytic transglycosylase RlpA family protein n=1 Tax=Asticcacaulis sp. 201 TaxID=3028787 RepID=UPI0029161D4A|nr:septal ring lytic transglycosylase RlpA family protein [Asticcacaulis sp. 201]MDV6329379.1 septal ring lytic transglycosylase RlpA family protein [Asticcacaulis sp. 201]